MSGNSTTSNNTLSPFDLTGIGMGFGLYRPRRPSYTFATQCSRQRSESYRYATRRENTDSTSEVSAGEDFIEGVLRKKARKISYFKGSKFQEEAHPASSSSPKVGVVVCDNVVTPAKVDLENGADEHMAWCLTTEQVGELPCKKVSDDFQNFNNDDNDLYESQNYVNHKCATQRCLTDNQLPAAGQIKSEIESQKKKQFPTHNKHINNKQLEKTQTPSPTITAISFNKNLIVLCASFILVFSSYRAIQNLQSSLHSRENLGTITMMIVHISMVIACLVAPIIINIFKAKWALCIGILCFLIWFAANFHPTFYTLVPTSIFVGFGQGILWNAESSYILKLAFDSAKAKKGHLDQEMFRFHGIFLACFQTTHIWGNLISSVLLSQKAYEVSSSPNASSLHGSLPGSLYLSGSDDVSNFSNEYTGFVEEVERGYKIRADCGALHRCRGATVTVFPDVDVGPAILSTVLWKLMTSYIVMGIASFGIILFLLDRIGARAHPEKSPKELVLQHLTQLVTHKTMKLLLPLLLFNGMQQGFIYSDYNHYFVTCTLGIHYVGYCMITLGVSNVLGAVFVAVFSHKIPREVVLGFGGIVHIALMIGYLIWIPDNNPVLFFVLAASWGVCDSVWQTQCKTLICLTCTEAPEIAFTNYRLVQSIGLAVMFGSETWMCVSGRLYLLMTLLVIAIMFYVLAEYRLRHDDDDNVFEDS